MIRFTTRMSSVVLAWALSAFIFTALPASAGEWAVAKSSGQVWLLSNSAQPVALGRGGSLDPGNWVQTGANGRALLTRGSETIVVAPNSLIGLPKTSKPRWTTILQQAGSLLLSVEKRDRKHFRVETPMLAVVVKGTQFNVAVTPQGGRVDVMRGKVEVSDFKSGQIALVLPGQTAAVDATSSGGITLSGSGQFAPIRQGRPTSPRLQPKPLPDGAAPQRTLQRAARAAAEPQAILSPQRTLNQAARGVVDAAAPMSRIQKAGSTLRIEGAIGEVAVNFSKATGGLVRGPAGGDATLGERNKGNGAVAFGGGIGLGSSAGGGGGGGGGGAGGTTSTATSGGGGGGLLPPLLDPPDLGLPDLGL